MFDNPGEPIGISILAFLLVKELFNYLKSRDRGDRRRPFSDDVDSALKISILPLLNKQTDILMELKNLSVQSRESDIRLLLGLETLNENDNKIRVNLHTLIDKIQSKIGMSH